jgi:hypothetical protein
MQSVFEKRVRTDPEWMWGLLVCNQSGLYQNGPSVRSWANSGQEVKDENERLDQLSVQNHRRNKINR